MRILSYNLWHGLAPTDTPWHFKYLESQSRRELRLKELKRVLKEVRPIILLLQEVNPLWALGGELGSELGYDVFLKEDIVGLKVLGFGLPSEIQSGLAIMVPPSFAAQERGAVKLSGGCGSFTSSFLSLHLSESRYALMVEWIHPQLGRALVVNAHLHHGLEWTEELWRDLRTLVDEGVISSAQFDRLNQKCLSGNQRRDQECGTLLGHLRELKDRYSVIWLGGDFNEGGSEGIHQKIFDFGFRDCWREAQTQSDQVFTFDPANNSENYKFSGQFPLTIDVDDLELSSLAHKAVTGLLFKHESKARRIDRLYMLTQVRVPIQVKSAQVIGCPNPPEEMAPSDHFGLLVEIQGVDS